jgi:hypothetical protein
VVHAEADLVHAAEELVALGLGEVALLRGEHHGEAHVDCDRVAVAERECGRELERRGPGVAERDGAVEADLVQVRRLELGETIRWRLDTTAEMMLTWSMTSMPRQQISSAISFSLGSAPSERPKRDSTRAGPWATRRSQMCFSATAVILTSSAKPLRTCASGSVLRNVKSRNVASGAWYAPSLRQA